MFDENSQGNKLTHVGNLEDDDDSKLENGKDQNSEEIMRKKEVDEAIKKKEEERKLEIQTLKNQMRKEMEEFKESLIDEQVIQFNVDSLFKNVGGSIAKD